MENNLELFAHNPDVSEKTQTADSSVDILKVLKINDNSNFSECFENMKINYIANVIDKQNKKLLYCGLENDKTNNKFFIETNFLKVLEIDEKNNKIVVELDAKTYNFFEELDNRCLYLLDNMFETSDYFEKMNIEIPSNLNFTTFIKDDITIIKIKLDTETQINYCNNNIKISEININDTSSTSKMSTILKGDMVRFLFSIESINVYTNENVTFARLFVHIADIYRPANYNFTKKNIVKEYVFANNSIETLKMEDEDISYAKNEHDSSNTGCSFADTYGAASSSTGCSFADNLLELEVPSKVVNDIIITKETITDKIVVEKQKRGRKKKLTA
jgi:hypothetical protein